MSTHWALFHACKLLDCARKTCANYVFAIFCQRGQVAPGSTLLILDSITWGGTPTLIQHSSVGIFCIAQQKRIINSPDCHDFVVWLWNAHTLHTLIVVRFAYLYVRSWDLTEMMSNHLHNLEYWSGNSEDYRPFLFLWSVYSRQWVRKH